MVGCPGEGGRLGVHSQETGGEGVHKRGFEGGSGGIEAGEIRGSGSGRKG